ncbi:MAG: hypothetical protein HY590_01800 [Candidatus Omnitrophica bacterium]|nr:hypothetical protein [Candidatus Omnitrophota bacterium]
MSPTGPNDPDLNLAKNRIERPDHFEDVKLADLIRLEIPRGISQEKWRREWPKETLEKVRVQEARAVRTEGYVVKGFPGKQESANCYSPKGDFHLLLAESPNDDRTKAMITETTPRIQDRHPTWEHERLQKLADDRAHVRISGWLMMDQQHLDLIGRGAATSWEIHPILQIEVLEKGKWKEL